MIYKSNDLTTTLDQLYDGLYFRAASWLTIDGGLNRLPLSFHPLVDKDTHMNRKIERIQFVPGKKGGKSRVQLHWRDNSQPQNSGLRTSTYDYALISAPFSVVRSWRLPFTLPTTITNAIHNLRYAQACKVALEYSTRFWEHYENPIVGGCSTTSDIPMIGFICYPSYDINGTGSATILASYNPQDDWPVSLSEEDHVRYVLDAMTEIHGEHTRQLYTGKYNRRCWALDPLEAAGWASPTVGQHQLYIPEYFKTYDGVSGFPSLPLSFTLEEFRSQICSSSLLASTRATHMPGSPRRWSRVSGERYSCCLVGHGQVSLVRGRLKLTCCRTWAGG